VSEKSPEVRHFRLLPHPKEVGPVVDRRRRSGSKKKKAYQNGGVWYILTGGREAIHEIPA